MLRLSRLGLWVCAASLLAAAGGPSRPDAALSQGKTALAQLPLHFEANRGQWDPAVRYAARADGYALLLTAGGPALSLPGSRRVEIRLLHSNRAAQIEALGRLPSHTDYFLGSREHWHTGVPHYSRVRYRAVYPGVDVIYYGSPSRLEYDFVLQPGADPRAIRLKFEGAGHLSITPEGDLAFQSAGARILQKRPLVYQEDPAGPSGHPARREIAGHYILLARDVVGLRVDRYDRTRPLVIDPTLSYCTYLGGTGADQINAVKVDANGLLYVTGSTTTGDLVATDGAYSGANAGLTDVFVAVIAMKAPGGPALQYLSYLGGSDLDTPAAMDLDSSGNIYIVGSTASTNFPMVGSSVQTTRAVGGYDAFVAVFNPAAYGSDSLVYSTYLGGSSDDFGRGIAVGPNGLVYIIGNTKSSDFPLTDSAYQIVLWGPQDAFLSVLDLYSSGLVYSTYLGGELADDGRAITVAPNGLVYFAVSTESTEFPMAGYAYNYNLTSGYGIVIGVMDMTQVGVNSLVYATYFGGSDIGEVRGIGFDAAGRLLVTGYTLATDFPVTPDACQPKAGGNGDAFVSVLNPLDPAHFLVYSTYLGGSQGEVGYAVASDAAGSLYVTGYTLSPNFPVTPDALQPKWGNGTDVFVTKLKPGVAGPGALQFSTYLGASGVYSPTGFALARDGTLYVVGWGTDGLPTSDTAIQGYAGGPSDGFIVVFSR